MLMALQINFWMPTAGILFFNFIAYTTLVITNFGCVHML